MSVDHGTFFSVEPRTLLVRNGQDWRLEPEFADDEDDEPTIERHKLFPVYREMLLQVVRDYSGIGDFRDLTMAEIRTFYNALRPELREGTKPREKPKR